MIFVVFKSVRMLSLLGQAHLFFEREAAQLTHCIASRHFWSRTLTQMDHIAPIRSVTFLALRASKNYLSFRVCLGMVYAVRLSKRHISTTLSYGTQWALKVVRKGQRNVHNQAVVISALLV